MAAKVKFSSYPSIPLRLPSESYLNNNSRDCRHRSLVTSVGNGIKKKIADLSGDFAVIYEECLEANEVVIADATDDLLERA